jgi:hypothetical protein
VILLLLAFSIRPKIGLLPLVELMVLTSLMAVTFFNVPIAPPPHVILRAVDPPAQSQTYETTTPDLLQGFSPGEQVSGSWLATLPQPIYPAPASGSQGKSTQTLPTPAPTTVPTPAPTQETTENWADRIWRRYKGGSN